jgi:AraC-like DNA-binding protein
LAISTTPLTERSSCLRRERDRVGLPALPRSRPARSCASARRIKVSSDQRGGSSPAQYRWQSMKSKPLGRPTAPAISTSELAEGSKLNPTAAELAATLGVPARTLHKYCIAFLGVSPRRYLQLRQLAKRPCHNPSRRSADGQNCRACSNGRLCPPGSFCRPLQGRLWRDARHDVATRGRVIRPPLQKSRSQRPKRKPRTGAEWRIHGLVHKRVGFARKKLRRFKNYVVGPLGLCQPLARPPPTPSAVWRGLTGSHCVERWSNDPPDRTASRKELERLRHDRFRGACDIEPGRNQ